MGIRGSCSSVVAHRLSRSSRSGLLHELADLLVTLATRHAGSEAEEVAVIMLLKAA